MTACPFTDFRISMCCFLVLTLLMSFFEMADARQAGELQEPRITLQNEEERGLPASRLEWNQDQLPDAEAVRARGSVQTYRFSAETPIPFTGVAIGWETDAGGPVAEQFQLEIRTRGKEAQWTGWVPARGYLEPVDSPSGLYWSMLYVTPDGKAHEEFEIILKTPPGIALSFVRVAAADARYTREEGDEGIEPGRQFQRGESMEKPSIIRRDGWWGSLPEQEREPDYEPVYISISHAVVHHTVTANRPPDPEQVIRNIWDWHVNENGWLDIGYNFLLDHLGNIYQGRYNPQLELTDVRGAHAGRANSSSVGIGLLGQFEPGASPSPGMPDNEALAALTELIAWRFAQNNIDPHGQSSIPVNPEGSAVLPTIAGHRDLSATACPGENLYTLLPDIRQGVSGQMEGHEEIAAPFELLGNYPNPFSSITRIEFEAEESMRVRIDLYSVKGARIRNLFNGQAEPGRNEVEMNAAGLASGVYFYRLTSGRFDQSRPMLYLR
jgi:hypothetical protein